MSNTALYRRFVDEAINQGNLGVVDELVAEEYVGRNPFAIIRGPKGLKAWVRAHRTAFPDLRYTIEELLSDGDKVIARLSFTGAHEGEFLLLRASGRKMKGTAMTITELRGGKFVRGWMEIDYLGMLQQLGMRKLTDLGGG